MIDAVNQKNQLILIFTTYQHMQVIIDGYSAPLTAGNFAKLVRYLDLTLASWIFGTIRRLAYIFHYVYNACYVLLSLNTQKNSICACDMSVFLGKDW